MSWAFGWVAYRIPCARPLATAHGVLTHRTGALLWLDTPGGVRGLGEVAPLPQLADRALARALVRLAELRGEVERGELGIGQLVAAWRDWSPAGRALRAALETALFDVQARRSGVPLARWLAANAQESVLVNAVVAALPVEAAVEEARAAVDAGFGTVKLKVGVAATEAAEIDRVAAVREAIGRGVRLRLDANGAWPVERAVRVLRAVAAYDVELVEQPVAAGDLAGLAEVRRRVPVPVAADEAVTGPVAARRILEREAADALVLKLPVVGGIAPARAIAELASEHGSRVIVTSTFETGVGIAAALHLAAALPEPKPACGLATAGLLEATLVREPLAPVRGVLRVPGGCGLGVTLDTGALARWQCNGEGTTETG